MEVGINELDAGGRLRSCSCVVCVGGIADGFGLSDQNEGSNTMRRRLTNEQV